MCYFNYACQKCKKQSLLAFELQLLRVVVRVQQVIWDQGSQPRFPVSQAMCGTRDQAVEFFIGSREGGSKGGKMK